MTETKESPATYDSLVTTLRGWRSVKIDWEHSYYDSVYGGLFESSVDEIHEGKDGDLIWSDDADDVKADTKSLEIRFVDPEVCDWKKFGEYIAERYPSAKSFYIIQYRGRYLKSLPEFIKIVKPLVFILECGSTTYQDDLVKAVRAVQPEGSHYIFSSMDARDHVDVTYETKGTGGIGGTGSAISTTPTTSTINVRTGARWEHDVGVKRGKVAPINIMPLIGIGAQDRFLM